ncbi:MAG: hypothetical protein WC905_01015 [Patescibacteria group bacterium]|jgi:hypothetical protein
MEQEKKPAEGSAISSGTGLSAAKPKLTPAWQMFEGSVKIWWANLKKFAMLYVWGFAFALIPLAAGLAFFGLNQITGLRANIFFSILSFLVFVAAFLLIIYFTTRSYIGMFLLVKDDYVGQERKIFKETKKWFWPYIGLTLLTTLFIILWTCLLIIPGIIFSVFYSFAVYAMFFEDKRGMAAIKRSVQLVKKYWWAVFGRVCLLCLIAWAFMVIISAPLSAVAEDSLFFSIWNAIVQVINILVGPIALIFSFQMYRDLVKIKK